MSNAIGVIPIPRTQLGGERLALIRLGGAPLCLWPALALSRAIDRADIVALTDDDDVARVFRSAGVAVEAYDAEIDSQRALIADVSRPFCSMHTVERALRGHIRELGSSQSGPIEGVRVTDAPSLEHARALARGLAPDHPCTRGIRAIRLGLPGTRLIEALVTDVDGVLTDGRIIIASDGSTARGFHFQDGLGIRLLETRGVPCAWLSASADDGVIRTRGEHLGVAHIDVGDGDKGERLKRICATLGVEPGATLYVGDDVNDLPAMKLAGLSACPANARPEVRAAVDIVLEARGGEGAIREVVDMIVSQRDRATS